MSTWKVAAAALPVGLVSIGTGLLVLQHARVSPPPAPVIAARWPTHNMGGEPRIMLDAQRTLGAPHVYRNLTVVPVYDEGATAADTYITLDEGLKARTVQVQEAQSGGDVNTLYITNRGQKPLYVMAGEVVLGGQQDRALGKDTIVPAGKTRVPIGVFCVEHGRWTGHADFESSARSVAAADIRLNALNGNFQAEHQIALAQRAHAAGTITGQPDAATLPANAYGVTATPPIIARQTLSAPAEIAANNAPPAVRAQTNVRPLTGLNNASPTPVGQEGEATVETDALRLASEEVGKAQQQVWDKVAAKNARFKTTSGTGTYRTALNMAGGDVSKAAPAYINALADSPGKDPHLVGVVAAVNGKIVAADIFGDAILFQKLWPKLLRSYAADAVEHDGESKSQFASVTPAQVKDFYAQAMSGKSRAENRMDSGVSTRVDAPETTTFRLLPTPKAAAGGAFNSKPLHETVLHK